MPDVAQLIARITAEDHASKTLDDVTGRLRLTQSAFQGLSATTVLRGGAMAGALLGIGVAAAKMAEQGVRSAADLEHSVANISTIKPDIDTTAVFKSLNDMQTRIPQTAKELGDSLYDVFSSIDNVTEAQGLRLVETFAKGATAAQTDARTFGTAISGVLNAYKLNVDDATKVSDVFFNTVNRGVVTGPQLASSLGPAVAAAKALGVSYEEAFALIVGATKEGGDAAQNINNITNLLSKLPTAEATVDLNALGVATQDVSGNLRKPIDVLTDLKAKLDGMTESARATVLLKIFPDIQARQGAQVVMSQLDIVKVALAENRTATNSTADAYAKMSATAVEQGKLLQNTWTALLTDLSVTALPALVGALGLVGTGVRDLREDFQQAQVTVGETVEVVQTTAAQVESDIDTLTTYMEHNQLPKWRAFWQTVSGANLPPMQETGPPPPVPPAQQTPEQRAISSAFEPQTPLTTGAYFPTLTPGEGAGHLSPEESGLGPLGNIRGQYENLWEDIKADNAARAAAAADAAAESYAGTLRRAHPAITIGAEQLGEDVVGGLAEAVAAGDERVLASIQALTDQAVTKLGSAGDAGGFAIVEQLRTQLFRMFPQIGASAMDALMQNMLDRAQADAPEVATAVAQSAALVARDLAEATERQKVADLGGAVAIREHTEALEQDRIAQLGGAVAIRDHADALERQKTADLGGAVAMREHTEALERQHVADLGGAVAIRDHTEALARQQDAALGGALAIRAHDEALAREKEQALGGVVAIRDHEDALARQKEQALGGALAIRAHDEALASEHEQALGGALAIRDHAEALTREQEAALGGALAIRAHDEALTQEKEQALGGAVAIRDHAEALQREHDAALGGALGIRAHEEALAREHEQALGGALSIRQHAEELAQEHEAALGGALAIRAHEEALARDKEQVLGGAVAIRDHAEALQREHDADLGGALAIRAHAEALTQEKEQALGGALAIRDHEEQLQRDKDAALGGVAAIDAHTEALRKQRLEAAAAQAGAGSAAALRNQIDTTQHGLEPEELQAQLAAATDKASASFEHHAAIQQVLQGTAAALAEQVAREAAAFAAFGVGVGSTVEPLGRLAATSLGLRDSLTGLPLGMQDIKSALTTVLPALEGATSRFHLVGAAYREMSDEVNGANLAHAAMALDFEFKEEGRAVQLLTQNMSQLSVAQQVVVDATVAQSGTMAGLDQTYGLLHKSSEQLQADLTGTATVGATFADMLDKRMASAATEWASKQNLATQALVATRIANHDAAGAFALTGKSINDITSATEAGGRAWANYASGTGLAVRQVREDFGALSEENKRAAASFEQLAAAGWKAVEAEAAALRAGYNLVAGINTGVGLTYTQIMAGLGNTGGTATATGASGGSSTPFVPSQQYGIPIVSPLTPGTLRGFASGGWITEPSYIVPTRTGRPSALAGEAGPEYVGGGQTTINVSYAPTFAGGTGLDKARVARELAGAIGDELSRAGFRVRG